MNANNEIFMSSEKFKPVFSLYRSAAFLQLEDLFRRLLGENRTHCQR